MIGELEQVLGVPGSNMPGNYPDLNSEQIWDVVNFLQVLPYKVEREKYGIELGDTTARLAEQQGFLEKVERRLEQAALPIRAAEAVFFWLAAIVISVLLAFFVWGVFVYLWSTPIFGMRQIWPFSTTRMSPTSTTSVSPGAASWTYTGPVHGLSCINGR